MPAQARKRFFEDGDKLMVGEGLWHEDTQNMSTEHVREATEEETNEFYGPDVPEDPATPLDESKPRKKQRGGKK